VKRDHLEPRRGSILVRQGKGGKRREVGMDERAWEHVEEWRRARLELPVGPFLCVLDGPTGGRAWSQPGAVRCGQARQSSRRDCPTASSATCFGLIT
jgi:integrase